MKWIACLVVLTGLSALTGCHASGSVGQAPQPAPVHTA